MRVGKINRYYSGVRRTRTTICCSAVALIVVVCALGSAQTPPPKPPALGPFRQIWTAQLEGALTALPSFSGERGFFPMDGDRLVAYDLTNGAPLWVAPRSVVLQPANGAGLVFGALATQLFALAEEDGRVVWEQPVAETLTTPLVWDNEWLIAATQSGAILAFRASDGEMIWRAEIGAGANARLALAADRVYVSAEDHRVVALGVEDGQTIWE